MHFSPTTFGDCFFELPTEIQTSILTYLSIDELLSLRLASKQCLAIFRANASTITRNAFLISKDSLEDAVPTHLLVELYPSTFCSTSSDAYFLRTLRRRLLVERQLLITLTFIQTRVYMLRLTRDLECEHFAPYRAGLHERLYESVLRIQHFFEIVRHLLVFSHPTHSSPQSTIDSCPNCLATIKGVIASWPDSQLVPMFQTIQLYILHFRAATRQPSSMTIFERKLKGWGYGPPPEEHQSQLVLLGGIPELCKINEMRGSYSKRLAVVKNFSDIVSEAVRINSLAFPDFYQTQTDPIMAMAGGEPNPAKNKKISTPLSSMPTPKSIRRDKEDVRTAIEARADERPTMKSLDVRLDLLTESILSSIPSIDTFLKGPESLLAKRILHLKLVEDERELLSPYAWLTALMTECYKPEAPSEVGETFSTYPYHP